MEKLQQVHLVLKQERLKMITDKINENVYLDFIEDGSYLNKIRNMPEIRDWCRQVGLIDNIQQEKWLTRISEDPTIRMYSIKGFSSDNPRANISLDLGVCGLTDIDHINQRAEFSCYVFPECQGYGYATDALKLLFRHGFNDLNLNMIWGETFDGNKALDLFTDKLGMKIEGTRRNFYYKKGKFIDAHLISISRSEFNAIH